jgi:hypothetical protein
MSIRGGEARNLIDDIGERCGWNAESKIDLLCDYINNQQDDGCLSDFLEAQAQEEESYSLEEEDEDEDDGSN